MIPDEKQYIVIAEGDRAIGVLDEAFVSEYGEIGVKFVEAGRCWKILEIYGNKVYVAPEEDPTGAVPSWVGDEIPVPLPVALEVGAIRREYAERAGGRRARGAVRHRVHARALPRGRGRDNAVPERGEGAGLAGPRDPLGQARHDREVGQVRRDPGDIRAQGEQAPRPGGRARRSRRGWGSPSPSTRTPTG